MDTSYIMSRIRHWIDWFIQRPLILILLAVVIMIFAVFSMDNRKSNAGSWVFIILAVILFLMALSGMTGYGIFTDLIWT